MGAAVMEELGGGGGIGGGKVALPALRNAASTGATGLSSREVPGCRMLEADKDAASTGAAGLSSRKVPGCSLLEADKDAACTGAAGLSSREVPGCRLLEADKERVGWRTSALRNTNTGEVEGDRLGDAELEARGGDSERLGGCIVERSRPEDEGSGAGCVLPKPQPKGGVMSITELMREQEVLSPW